MTDELKAAVTVSEMARMLGMSRSRFYQLMGSTFPSPIRDDNGRPYFDEEGQRTCLEVRRRNCGIDGKPILFYAPRNSITPRSRLAKKATPKPKVDDRVAAVLAGVQALGQPATTKQVEAALQTLECDRLNEAELIRRVFLHIRKGQA